MIPVASFSPLFLGLLTLSMLAGAALALFWLAVHGNQRVRRWRQRHGRGTVWLSAGLGVLFVPYVAWQALGLWSLIAGAREQAALRVTLEAPTRVAGIDMPAGSELVLKEKDRLESFEWVAFPAPVSVYGFQASAVRRFLDRGEQGRHYVPRRLRMRLTGDQEWDGWRCAGDEPLTADLDPGGTPQWVNGCVLAAGNRLAGAGLPAGSALRASKGTVYTNGRRDPDRWVVELPEAEAVPLAGARLRGRIHLDAEHRPVRVQGALDDAFSLGALSYPEGTRVRVRFKTGQPESWWFSPVEDGAARRRDGPPVPPGQAVHQDPEGRVLAITDNQSAGFFQAVPVR
ncbi:hypothetical protein ACLD0W_02090 [Alloalcanivorax sp. C16-1]|uniref:hypothetical protein n=1 Tax=Alloalcanivorax sp. C16-1 TaxID=3390051 RepID=UPI003970DE60